MIRVLLILIVLGAIFWWMHQYRSASGEEKKQWRNKGLIGLLIGLVFLLALTGRLHWIAAAISGVFLLLRQLYRLWPAIKWWLERKRPKGREDHSRIRPRGRGMSREEALSVLGLGASPDREEIILAHRRAIQQAHPDRGGSAEAAARINLARDVLLENE